MSDSFQSHGLFSPWNSPGQNMGVGILSLLQGISPTQGLNPRPLHCRQILNQLSHQRSPRILERVAYPSPVDLPDPGIELRSPVLQVGSLPTELSGKPISKVMSLLFNMLSRLVIAFLPRNKCLLISWLQSPSAVILKPQKIKSLTVPTVSPSICHEVMGSDAMILVF